METGKQPIIEKDVAVLIVGSDTSGITHEMWESEQTKKTLNDLVGKTLPGEVVFMHDLNFHNAILMARRWYQIDPMRHFLNVTIKSVDGSGAVLADVEFRSERIHKEYRDGNVAFFPRMVTTIDGMHVTELHCMDFGVMRR